MIIKNFNNGWGPEFGIKRFEQSIVDRYLEPIKQDSRSTVIINSVWYTEQYHAQVISELKQMSVERVIIVSMLDSAIVKPAWFEELDCEICCLGYYHGPDSIDFWALAVHEFLDISGYDDIMDAARIDTAYMCLNRKPHWHRVKLYQQLESAGILDHGIVSMGGEGGQPVKLLEMDHGQSDLAPNPGPEQYGISNDILSLGHVSNWRRHFMNTVTETVFDINQNLFVSEKIFKPILGSRPFLVYDPDGAVTWLEQRGFMSYVNDFDDITDLDLRQPGSMAPFLATLCQQGSHYWQKKFVDLADKIIYNKEQFRRYVEQQTQKINQGIKCQI
jgi:hypothetical protein